MKIPGGEKGLKAEGPQMGEKANIRPSQQAPAQCRRRSGATHFPSIVEEKGEGGRGAPSHILLPRGKTLLTGKPLDPGMSSDKGNQRMKL